MKTTFGLRFAEHVFPGLWMGSPEFWEIRAPAPTPADHQERAFEAAALEAQEGQLFALELLGKILEAIAQHRRAHQENPLEFPEAKDDVDEEDGCGEAEFETQHPLASPFAHLPAGSTAAAGGALPGSRCVRHFSPLPGDALVGDDGLLFHRIVKYFCMFF